MLLPGSTTWVYLIQSLKNRVVFLWCKCPSVDRAEKKKKAGAINPHLQAGQGAGTTLHKQKLGENVSFYMYILGIG